MSTQLFLYSLQNYASFVARTASPGCYYCSMPTPHFEQQKHAFPVFSRAQLSGLQTKIYTRCFLTLNDIALDVSRLFSMPYKGFFDLNDSGVDVVLISSFRRNEASSGPVFLHLTKHCRQFIYHNL